MTTTHTTPLVQRTPSPSVASDQLPNLDIASKFGYAVVAVYIVVTATVPYTYGTVLAVLLGVALLAQFFRGSRIPVAAVVWAIILGILGALGALVGLWNHNAGAWSTTSIFVYEPLILAILLGCLYGAPGAGKYLVGALDLALVCVAVVGLAIYAGQHFGFSMPHQVVAPEYTAVDLTGDTIRANYQGFNSLVFLAPYGIVRAATQNGFRASTIRRAILVAAVAAGIVLSGRRILYLISPLAPVAVLLLCRHRLRPIAGWRTVGRTLVAFLISTGVIGVAIQFAGISATAALQRTLGQVTLSDPSGVRTVQSRELLARWQQSPIIGHGAGATVPGYVRDPASPWSFELSYHVILLDFGIIGATVLGLWGAWVCWRLMCQGRAASMTARCVLAGFIGAVLSAAVDPYLFKIDGMWMVFAPFGLATASLLQNKTPGGPAR